MDKTCELCAGTPEELAALFHETYERLAPSYGYETRRESRKPWAEVPEQNRALMTAVCAELMGLQPPEDADHSAVRTCELCGCPVRVVGSDEGTMSYERLPEQAARERAYLHVLRNLDDILMQYARNGKAEAVIALVDVRLWLQRVIESRPDKADDASEGE